MGTQTGEQGVGPTYSQFLAQKTPTCWVSLSSFYNETIVPCHTCTCEGQNNVTQPIVPCLHRSVHVLLVDLYEGFNKLFTHRHVFCIKLRYF